MNNSDQLSGQTSKPPDHPHDTAGMMLRTARESANLTQATVGDALHLTVHYIKALENDDYSKLPGTTFVKGYLRVYARYLKLDVNAVLASYERNNVSEEESANRTQVSSRNQKRHDQTFKWAVVTAIIVVLGVVAGWWFVGKDQVAADVISTTSSTPAQRPVQQPLDQPASGPATASVNRSSVHQLETVPAVASDAAVPGATTGYNPAGDTTALNDATVVNAGSALAVDTAISGDALSADAASTAAGISQAPAPFASTAMDASAANNQELPSVQALPASAAQNSVTLTTTAAANGSRKVTLTGAGADTLQLDFNGTSWVEIEDDANGRMYNETLNSGDAITLRGTAPFKLLLGDATQIKLSFNSVPIDLTSQIRSDKTARFALGISNPSANIATSTQGANP